MHIITLARETAPNVDAKSHLAGTLIIGGETCALRVTDGEHYAAMTHAYYRHRGEHVESMIHSEHVWQAIERAGARLWNAREWRASFAEVLGVRAGRIQQWRRESRLPPAHVIAWIAYISARPNHRAIGYYIRALAAVDDPDAWPRDVPMINEAALALRHPAQQKDQ